MSLVQHVAHGACLLPNEPTSFMRPCRPLHGYALDFDPLHAPAEYHAIEPLRRWLGAAGGSSVWGAAGPTLWRRVPVVVKVGLDRL